MLINHTNHQQHPELLGGKAKALAALAEIDANIPPWFVIPPGTTLEHDTLAAALAELGAESFAVRSSATAEDGAAHSFAGQYSSFLYVPADQVAAKIQQVRQSNANDHLDTYRQAKQVSASEQPSALVQAMITPEISGVAFAADPVTGRRDHTVISSAWGTGSAIVSGEIDADQFVIDSNLQVIRKQIAEKKHQHIADSSQLEGVKLTEVEHEKVHIPSLTYQQMVEITKLVHRCSEYFGCFQDIEWAISGENLYLLQSRPITNLAHLPDPSDPLTIWDNSNIAESYPGITSPLTFSFASRIYEHVYREFCALLQVPKSRIKKHDDVFPKMLGHIQGRVYYNLISWYRVLALLPGFHFNRTFMEQMMGVKKAMPDEVVTPIIAANKVGKIRDFIGFSLCLIGLIRNHFTLPHQIRSFQRRLDRALVVDASALKSMHSHELVAHYDELEAQLLKRWDAPLVNDFFAMIHHGILKSLCGKWLKDPTLQTKFLLECGEIISAEPPRLIAAMADLLRPHHDLAQQFASQATPTKQKLALLDQIPELKKSYDAYILRFGDRCLEELKLESPTLEDDPHSLLASIGALALREKSKASAKPTPPSYASLPWAKRLIFSRVLKHARKTMQQRENLRFERTRLFGRIRRIMVELDRCLVQDKVLPSRGDIFHLQLQEVLGLYSGTTDAATLPAIIEARKTQLSAYSTAPAPPDRIEARGALYRHQQFKSDLPTLATEGASLVGTAASPGIVRGRVRVVLDPRNAHLEEGEILVAQQTDPGWVVLFPSASGLLVERGSLLSHSAIVARELQLPCIVSIPHVTTLLKTGDQVEMNATTGTITIIAHPQTARS